MTNTSAKTFFWKGGMDFATETILISPELY